MTHDCGNVGRRTGPCSGEITCTGLPRLRAIGVTKGAHPSRFESGPQSSMNAHESTAPPVKEERE